jgi:branched-chain amino acid transport system ATP-binding protein
VGVLSEVTVHVSEGQVVALLGSNGAGKTTLLRAINGLLRPTSGSITFDGKDLTKVRATEVVHAGIAHVMEGRRLFVSQSVEANLVLGLWRSGLSRTAQHERVEEILVQFPILANRLKARAGELSGGQQQMLAIAQALMRKPRVVMLDEPSVGLAPALVDEVFSVVESLRSDGCGVLLVEQDATRALALADDAYVMQTGQVLVHRPPAEIEGDVLRQAYLGAAAVGE